MSPSTGDLAERARRVLAGGSTHVARSYRPPLHVARAEGSRKWLVDGREVLDYTMGHGALLLGHAHPAVVAAVREQVGRGTHYAAGHALEIEWAERLCALIPSVEQVRFTSSGTEAAMLALRIARAATGRQRVVKVDDHFHGWSDAVLVNLDAEGRPATPAGVPPLMTELTSVVRPDDLDGLARTLARRDAAAFIIEASGAHYGRTPLAGHVVRAARQLCEETGTLFVIDEVITGFRVGPGGLQEALGIRPDLTVLAKVMAGGLPGGAVGGRRDLMEQLAAPPQLPGAPGEALIAHPGTFNANPLSAVAGIATLDLVSDGTAQRRAAAHAAALEEVLRGALERAGVPGRVWRFSSIVHCALDDPAAHRQLAEAMRAHGVDLFHTSAFCSAAHGDGDLEIAGGAMAASLAGLRQPAPA